ncbi:MAG: DedA family protein [Oligoflexia bacterium]|nr:DedA family protein [Oligoflexia bacterium]
METLVNTLMAQNGSISYIVIFFLLLACGFGLPMPEDIILFSAGLMSYYGASDVHIMIIVCFAGVMIGDSAVYFLGAKYGKRIRKISIVKKILPPKRMKIVRKKLHEQGNKVIFAARFMPGFRAPVFFSSGLLKLPFQIFAFYDGLAALLSVPTIVYVVYFFGEHVDKVIKVIKQVQFGVIGAIVTIVLVVSLKAWWSYKKQQELEN